MFDNNRVRVDRTDTLPSKNCNSKPLEANYNEGCKSNNISSDSHFARSKIVDKSYIDANNIVSDIMPVNNYYREEEQCLTFEEKLNDQLTGKCPKKDSVSLRHRFSKKKYSEFDPPNSLKKFADKKENPDSLKLDDRKDKNTNQCTIEAMNSLRNIENNPNNDTSGTEFNYEHNAPINLLSQNNKYIMQDKAADLHKINKFKKKEKLKDQDKEPKTQINEAFDNSLCDIEVYKRYNLCLNGINLHYEQEILESIEKKQINKQNQDSMGKDNLYREVNYSPSLRNKTSMDGNEDTINDNLIKITKMSLKFIEEDESFNEFVDKDNNQFYKYPGCDINKVSNTNYDVDSPYKGNNKQQLSSTNILLTTLATNNDRIKRMNYKFHNTGINLVEIDTFIDSCRKFIYHNILVKNVDTPNNKRNTKIPKNSELKSIIKNTLTIEELDESLNLLLARDINQTKNMLKLLKTKKRKKKSNSMFNHINKMWYVMWVVIRIRNIKEQEKYIITTFIQLTIN